MSHYDEQRENDMCGIEKQIAEYCNADNDAITCPDCKEFVDEIFDGRRTSYICPFCEVEVSNDEE